MSVISRSISNTKYFLVLVSKIKERKINEMLPSRFLRSLISFHNPVSIRNIGFLNDINASGTIFSFVTEFMHARLTK